MANDEPAPDLAAARLAYEQRDFAAALRLLDALTPERQRSAQALNLRGNVHLACEHAAEARRFYQAAFDADPGYAKARFNLGLACLGDGETAAAADHLHVSLQSSPGTSEDHLLAGNVLQAAGRLDDAMTHWRRATDIEPTQFAAWINLGSHSRAAGRLPDAIAALTRAVAIAPGVAQAHLELGIALREAGELAPAVESLRKASELDPAGLAPTLHLADALRLVDRSAEAMLLLDALASRHPGEGAIAKLQGLLALQSGQREAAAAHYARALELRPGDEEVRHLRDAAEGRRVDTAPAGYVRALFDDFAGRFDAELVEGLRYAVPEVLAAELLRALPAERTGKLVDLGCGTGLVGEALRGSGLRLTGVDLSPRMLDKARERGLYEELVCADLLDFLANAVPQSFVAATAADVLIYEGRIEQVLAGCMRVLVRGGVVALSIETHDEPDAGITVLRPSGRFSHHADTVVSRALALGFEVLQQRTLVLRMDQGRPLAGAVLVFRAGGH